MELKAGRGLEMGCNYIVYDLALLKSLLRKVVSDVHGLLEVALMMS